MLKTDLIALQSELKYLSQNTTIIHGTNDNLVPYKNVEFMKSSFSKVNELNIITLENEKHFIVWDQEKFIKETITSWVD